MVIYLDWRKSYIFAWWHALLAEATQLCNEMSTELIKLKIIRKLSVFA